MAQRTRSPTASGGRAPGIDAATTPEVEVGAGDTVALDRFNGKPYKVEDAGNGRYKLWPVTLNAAPSPLIVGKRALAASIARGKARVTDAPVGAETLAEGEVGKDWSRERELDNRAGRGQ